MYAVLATNPDTSGGAPAYRYVSSFKSEIDAIKFAEKMRTEEVAKYKSWASYYEVYKLIIQ